MAIAGLLAVAGVVGMDMGAFLQDIHKKAFLGWALRAVSALSVFTAIMLAHAAGRAIT